MLQLFPVLSLAAGGTERAAVAGEYLIQETC
jgi:hypothetical protein